MATNSIYVRGASVEDVQAAVARVFESELGWRVEEAPDYPGYDIAIDVYAGNDARAAEVATKLIQDLRASTSFKIELADVLDAEIVARQKYGIGYTSS